MKKVAAKAKCVVWDLDGTLLDSFKLQTLVLTEVLQRRGMKVPSHEEFVRHYHGRLRDSIKGLSGSDGAALDEIYEDFIQSEEHFYEDPDGLYFPDAIQLLQRNHSAGLRQVIMSNRPHFNDARLGSPRNLAKRKPLAGLIDVVVCGDDNIDFHKPDPRILDHAERTLGIDRGELIVIGDQFVDAELAGNLNVQAILVSRDSAKIPHLERLADGWEDRVQIVTSLDEVVLTLA